MGRPKRTGEVGMIYHMINRANRRETIFHKDAFWRFVATQRETRLLRSCPSSPTSGVTAVFGVGDTQLRVKRGLR